MDECGSAARLVGLQTVKAPPVAVAGTVATSLITIEVGIAGVSTLLIRSFLADSDTKAFGVTRQAQQETSSSDGSNVKTLTQMLPAPRPVVLLL